MLREPGVKAILGISECKSIPPLQVNTNGILSFDVGFPQCCPRPFPVGDDVFLVAPFWSDVDIRMVGDISFEVHSVDDLDSWVHLREVNSFVSNYTGNQFDGTWMLVAFWDSVHPYPHGDGRQDEFTVCLCGLNFSKMHATFLVPLISNNKHQRATVYTYCNILYDIGVDDMLCKHCNYSTSYRA